MNVIPAIETTTTKRVVQIELDSEVAEALINLYQLIWCEAFYDFNTEDTQKFAQRIYPHIKRLNEILRFKT